MALVRGISEGCTADTVGGNVLAYLEGRRRRHNHGADITPWSQQLPYHASCSITPLSQDPRAHISKACPPASLVTAILHVSKSPYEAFWAVEIKRVQDRESTEFEQTESIAQADLSHHSSCSHEVLPVSWGSICVLCCWSASCSARLPSS